MKALVPVLAILAAGTAFAQRSGGGPRPGGYGSSSGYGSVSGFGSILNPGTGRPPGAYSGWNFSGRGGHAGYGYGRGYRSRGYPVFIGGYYPYGYGYGYGYDQPGQVEQPPPPQTSYAQEPTAQGGPPPTVIINQYFRSDGPAGATTMGGDAPAAYQTPAVRQEDKPTIYLIAMKDHTIMPALGYWVQGDTLTYITSEGTKNSVSLTLVDREFSKRLNDERNVDFTL